MTANKADDIISMKANVTICCEVDDGIHGETDIRIRREAVNIIWQAAEDRIFQVASERALQ